VYCVPYHLPQPAWDPLPLVVQRLRQYPIGRALSIAAGKGFTVVVTARREQSTEEQKNKKKNRKKNRKDENHEKHENQHTVTTLPLTLANIEQQEQEHQQTAQAHPFEDGEERELREADVEELAVYSEESENSSVDSDLENERKEQLRLERQHEAEEDALIEQMGMRVLDERGDIVLHPDHAPTPSSQPQVRVARDLFDVGCVAV
jgi:type III secretory pathway component EscV